MKIGEVVAMLETSVENNYKLSEKILKELGEYDQSVFLSYLDCVWEAGACLVEGNKIVFDYGDDMIKYNSTIDLMADIYYTFEQWEEEGSDPEDFDLEEFPKPKSAKIKRRMKSKKPFGVLYDEDEDDEILESIKSEKIIFL